MSGEPKRVPDPNPELQRKGIEDRGYVSPVPANEDTRQTTWPGKSGGETPTRETPQTPPVGPGGVKQDPQNPADA